jgi:hypothetical protein
MSVFPLAAFPPLSFVAGMIKSEEVIIDPNEHFVKQTIRSRYEIAGPNGRQMLSIPVLKGRRPGVSLKALKLSKVEPWQDIHWKSIVTAYNASPYFMYYQDEVEGMIKQKTDSLFDYNYQNLISVLELMDLDIDVKVSEQYIEGYKGLDYRKFPKDASSQVVAPYIQVFDVQHGFMNNLSILDLLFNMGPESAFYLENLP